MKKLSQFNSIFPFHKHKALCYINCLKGNQIKRISHFIPLLIQFAGYAKLFILYFASVNTLCDLRNIYSAWQIELHIIWGSSRQLRHLIAGLFEAAWNYVLNFHCEILIRNCKYLVDKVMLVVKELVVK